MESAPLRQPPLLHNRYQITARLGMTRLALVYRATDLRLQRTILVHLLRPEHQDQVALRERFLDEARRRASRPHPALLEVYDSGEVGGRPFLITEDVHGRTLQEALPLPLNEALRILRQIVGAAIACQESGIPAPPITSSTLLLSDEGRPVLVEPWWLSPEELALHVAHYRAPERSLGGPPVAATPVYSLGILGYELFSGRRPFTGATPREIAQQHVQQSLPPAIKILPGFAPRLAQVLTAATASRPEDRLPDLAALSRELAAVEAAADMPTQPLSAPLRPLGQSMRESLRPVTGVLRRATESRPVPPPPAWIAPPPPAPATQPKPVDLKKEVQKEVRRELRRRGCRRRLARQLIGLALMLSIVGGCLWAVNYGLTWVQRGGARSACRDALPGFVCDLLPGGGVFVVKTDLNLRSAPRIEPANVVGVLTAGTRVQQIGSPEVVGNITWLPVRAELDGRQVEGWVSFDYLRQAE